MKKLRIKIILELIIFIVLLVYPLTVKATDDTYTTASTINGIIIKWSYKLNDSNQIVDLKAINTNEIVGELTIPSTLDDKIVVALGKEAFKNSVGLTGIKIPDSVTKIEYSAFQDCTSLTEVDLGNIQSISFNAFKNCPNLKSIEIPKTLTNGSSVNEGIFTGTTKLTSVKFEDGLTQIPAGILQNCTDIRTVDIPNTVTSIECYAFANTGIEEITIPNSVTKIEYSAFKDCTSLTKVDLGNIESIAFSAFQGCTSLESIMIPNTLKEGSVEPIFSGCTKLSTIILEEGLEIIPTYLCANTNITSIKIPDSVTKIGYSAFQDCINLTEVDLGKIQSISFNAFKNCPNLKSIEIPKTLTNGSSVNEGIFTGSTKLTSVKFEDGITKIPAGILQDCTDIKTVIIPNTVTNIECYAFANTGIEEITIPNSVSKIQYYAFINNSNLKKITILDNCTDIGWFFSMPTEDTVFTNHNDELTIYCYEGSKIAEYAIATNIKYVYLPRESIENETDENPQEQIEDKTEDKTDDKKDTTTAQTKLPAAGIDMVIVSIIIGAIIIAAITIKKYNTYRDIK